MFYLVIGEEPFYYELDLDNYFEDKLKPSYFRGKGRYKIWVLNIEDRKKETIKAKIKGRKLLEYFNNKQETNLFEEIENIYQQLKRYIVVMKRIEIPKEEENPEEETKKKYYVNVFSGEIKNLFVDGFAYLECPNCFFEGNCRNATIDGEGEIKFMRYSYKGNFSQGRFVIYFILFLNFLFFSFDGKGKI